MPDAFLSATLTDFQALVLSALGVIQARVDEHRVGRERKLDAGQLEMWKEDDECDEA